jgi:hypothetical protein
MTALTMEERAALKRIETGAVVYQDGIYVSDGVDCLWSLPAQTVARIMGRVAGTMGLADDVDGTLELNEAGKKALASGSYGSIDA